MPLSSVQVSKHLLLHALLVPTQRTASVYRSVESIYDRILAAEVAALQVLICCVHACADSDRNES